MVSMDGNLYALNVYLDNQEAAEREYEENEEQLNMESLEDSFDPATDGREVTKFA